MTTTHKITIVPPITAAKLVANDEQAARDQVNWNVVQAVAAQQITPL